MTIHIDQLQRRIELPNVPQRIISLVPSQTELLYHWGVGDQVVGITKFCVHPATWYRTKTRIGGTKTVNLDRIAALAPDLIIGNKEENTQSDIEALMECYPVWMSDIYTLDDALAMMTQLGSVVGTPTQADQLVQQLTQDFGQLPKQAPRRVAYLIWRKPWMVAATNTFIDDLLQRAGWQNAFGDQRRYPVVADAALQAADPEVLLLSSEPYPFKEKHIAELQAICPMAKILLVDGELFSWYGSRLLETADYIRTLGKHLIKMC